MKVIVIKTTTLVTTEVFRGEAKDTPSYPTITDRAMDLATHGQAIAVNEERIVKFQVLEEK
mgnify:CR=1 FL=1